VTYYVRVATRGSPKTVSPRQALNYITDGHDAPRDSSYSDAELHYIARMDPGWKTNLEGGRVPLVGFGQHRAAVAAAAGLLDEEPGWTLKGAAAHKLALDMNRDLAHGKQLER
jgi:hypothetical protein